MTLLAMISNNLPGGAQNTALLRGVGAFASAELSVRVIRLLALIVISRSLTPDILGSAALALTLFEVMRVLANIGVGQQIIAAPGELLAATCNTAHRIFWRWCAALTAIQLVLAGIVAAVTNNAATGGMIAILSLVYLTMPSGLVQCYLLMRGGRAATTAAIGASQTISDHILTACLVIIWPSPWSIILPKLLTTPIWLLSMRHAMPWRRARCATIIPARALLGQALAILISEIMVAARTQADKLIVAAFLGVQALGVYFFAFNAGIGLLTSIITAYSTLTFPMICGGADAFERRKIAKKLMLAAALTVLPLVLLQLLLAPIYVPLIFGDRWHGVIALVTTLCLAGLPMMLMALVSNYLRSQGAAHIDAMASFLASAFALAGLSIGAIFGGLQLAASLWVSGLCIVAVPYAFYAFGDRRTHIFSQKNKDRTQ